ncbi:sulfite exporter TauE/SafE family protein [Campylobacter hyointestinalis]|uniref:sulfite exporter TauE/SafE family protein n=1 Tax=Campylobacter hyointestinalis TaxID=198 RepID=UPI000DCC654E|nr:sulfite exporter TauE/SafE family protein [Campylobacter hyointestinalis]RAZ24267.1 sulfite exporter TauE/SafE family protein [Campylobacter hyointestinalis subsp. lawsonii]RAZ37887.1 sulfite exporter TauE/SafE family protein [Campylobacter hyointestinalis subsp. lawsonii]RAZ51585.1 sulfite exporter TauE/SafE family protein [Campylobacter hyointestinalis subsp. lawsonii]
MEFSYIFIGIVAGISSGLFGIGGGMIIVPFMLSVGMSSHNAIAISVFQMMFSSVFGSFMNYKKRNLNINDGILVGLGGLVGASFSGTIVRLFSDVALTSVFLCLSIIFFLKYAFGIKNVVIQTKRNELQKRLILIGAGTLTGVFAISLGIGGGLLIAPILGYTLGFDSKKVVPISLFFVIFASLSGTISFISSGVINKDIVNAGISVGISSMIGVIIGIKIIEKMQVKAHKKVLLGVYLLSIILTFIGLLRKLEILSF